MRKIVATVLIITALLVSGVSVATFHGSTISIAYAAGGDGGE